MIFTPPLHVNDVGDQYILTEIPIWSYITKMSKKRGFPLFFKLPPKSKILFWVSKHVESSMFEGVGTQFEAHSMIVISQLDVGDQYILAEISFWNYITISASK